MANQAGVRVLFTGISGVGASHSLKTLRDYSFTQSVSVDALKAEVHFCTKVRETGLFRSIDCAGKAEETILALNFPKPILENCWRKAFGQLAEEKGFSTPEKNILLHTHACFYHQKSREFLSLHDTGLIKKLFAPDVVITLIDDIDNIHNRLRQQGEMFSKVAYCYSGFDGFVRALQNRALLMNWRASEFAFAERLARALSCKHYLLAVKHPVETAFSLIFRRERRRVYLSHPISEPRRMLAAGKTDDFMDFSRRLKSTCAELRKHATVIEPTTIDEFRFRRFEVEGETGRAPIFLPVLTDRWPFPDAPEHLMWKRVQDDSSDLLESPTFFEDSDIETYQDQKSRGQSAKMDLGADGKLGLIEIATQLMSALIGETEDQIAARDFKLVEQCDCMVVIRPLFAGNYSRGVRAEINHYCELVARFPERRHPIWVYTTKSDENLWRIATMAAAFWKKPEIGENFSKDEVAEVVRPLDLNQRSIAIVASVLDELTKIRTFTLRIDHGVLEPTQESKTVLWQNDMAKVVESAKIPPYRSGLEKFEKELDVKIKFEVVEGEDWPNDKFFKKVFGQDGK